jgi:hypothetical protein
MAARTKCSSFPKRTGRKTSPGGGWALDACRRPITTCPSRPAGITSLVVGGDFDGVFGWRQLTGRLCLRGAVRRDARRKAWGDLPKRRTNARRMRSGSTKPTEAAIASIGCEMAGLQPYTATVQQVRSNSLNNTLNGFARCPRSTMTGCASSCTPAFTPTDRSINRTSMTFSGFESPFSPAPRTSVVSLSMGTRQSRPASLTNGQTD